MGMSKKEPEKVQLGEVELCCQICKNDQFWRREAQLNTAMATFFNLDWANKTADCYVCSQCGYIHWFLPLKKK